MIKKLIYFFRSKNKDQQQKEYLLIFNKVRYLITDNYAGWFDKTEKKYSKLQVLTAKTIQRIKKAKNLEKAFSIIDEWINFFEDQHLTLYNSKKHNIVFHPPSLQFFKEDCALITLQNCNDESRFPLRNILHQPRLQKTPYWIIDLRGNQGGLSDVIDQFSPFIQTKSIQYWQGKARVTEINANAWFSYYLADIYDNMDSFQKQKFDDQFLKFVQTKKGTFHKWLSDENEPYTIKPFFTPKKNPQKVAILVDKETASAGEIFLLSAQQSDKVTIMGTNTRGMMDYGFVNYFSIAKDKRTLCIPMVRFNWLNYGLSFDNKGFPPQKYIAPNILDWESIAYQHLKNAQQLK